MIYEKGFQFNYPPLASDSSYATAPKQSSYATALSNTVILDM